MARPAWIGYWLGGSARAARRWVARRRLARHGLVIRDLIAEDLAPLGAALQAPDLGPSALDLQRQGLQELCIAVGWVGRLPVALGFVEWAGPRQSALRGPWPGVPEIYRLQVLPAYRSMSVGARLIDYLEQRARQRGHGRIGLGVHRSNARALALYRQLGYGPDATPFTDGYLSPGPDGVPRPVEEPALFLVRELAPRGRKAEHGRPGSTPAGDAA